MLFSDANSILSDYRDVSFKDPTHRRPINVEASTKSIHLSVGSAVSRRDRVDLKVAASFLRGRRNSQESF